ncbi:MAG: hypothetical protein IKR70_04245 [Lachnospiraceae bacterium]|nr:hypothetical protein [Lachnospiraceae bacterium]
MEEEKNLNNAPADETENITDVQETETKEMSSEAVKVNMYSLEDKYTNDPNFDNEEFMRYWTPAERRRRVRAANKVKKGKKVRKKMTKVGKIVLGICCAALVCVALYFVHYFIYYVNYDEYKKYLSSYEYEEAKAYTPLADSGAGVPGFELAAETEYLKLYTDRTTANVAVYDKRNGEVMYANPVDADDDTVANAANINIMKSQFILYYYNTDVVSGTFNSYTDCVAKGKVSIEGLEDGFRYIYNIGDGNVMFNIPLEYRIKDDYLEVSIPADHIEELGPGYVYRIQLLRYMAAPSKDDLGYMVVPNGSGSLINYNNGKTSAAAYSQYIYDIDPLAANYTTLEETESARLPLYGFCNTDSSVLVTVEDSATNCVITAGVSGVYSDYNYAFPTFVYRITDNLRMFGDSTTDVYVMEPELYQSNVCVRYTMLTDEYSGYSGMANYYRERLESEGVLVKDESATGDIPFYYDVITGVKEIGHFLGVQYLHTFAMTTFDEAAVMSNDFAGAGISNQVMNIQGWFNGGYYHDATDNVRVIGKLGGRSDLAALNDTVKNNGGILYGDVALQKVTFADRWFPYGKVASRYYGAGYTASFGLINPTTLRNTSGLGYTENRYNLLSPKFLPRYVQSFINKTENIAIDGYSLRDLGCVVASDKKRTCMIDREQALDVIIGQYELLSATGKRLMTNKANAYSFGYTTDILNAPLYDTKYDIIDETIPFYEMVVHGYIDYSSDLLNFKNADDMDSEVLHLIETGASPHYVFTMEESSRMKMTALNCFYTTTYDVWKDRAVDVYTSVNDALKYVSGCAIVDHQIIDDDVRRVVYDNGVSIILNYSDEEITLDGTVVPAKSYRLEGI